MRLTIFYIVIVAAFFASLNSPAQSIKAKEFKDLITHNTIIELLTEKKFTTVYSGPKKETGLLTCLHNRKDNEFLFIDQYNDRTLQTITYYIPAYDDYNKLYLALKGYGINVSKQGRTLYENNGKKYYQLVIQCEPVIEKN